MPYLVGEAFDYNDFVKQVRGFVQGHPQLNKSNPKLINSGVAITGTGDGVVYLTTEAHTPATMEITLTCTTAGGDNTSPKAAFSVERTDAGSESLGTLVSGERFSYGDSGASPQLYGIGIILRTTTDWALNDTIVFALEAHNLSTLESPNSIGNWVEDRFTEGAPNIDGDFVIEWIAHAPTTAAAGQSPENPQHFGMQTLFSQASNYFNVRLAGMDAYVSSSDFDQQPNYSGARYLLLAQSAFRFWLVATSDGLVACCKISSVYQWVTLSLLDVYSTGNQHPKPMLVGGMSEVSTAQPSEFDNDLNASFWNPGDESSLLFRWVDGTWLEFKNRGTTYSQTSSTPLTALKMVWPFRDPNTKTINLPLIGHPTDARELTQTLRPRYDGTYELIPIQLIMQSPQFAVVGEIRFIKFISGFNVASEDTGDDTSVSPNEEFVILQNANLTGRQDFVALEFVA